MHVFRKIVVTMDCSAVDDEIIRHVTALARQNAAKVCLLHVVHSHTLDQHRALREKAEKNLTVRLEALQRQRIDAYILIRSGEPETEILAEVEGGDYDLAAMATHGHTFIADALLGSVSRALKHQLRIPLLLVRGEVAPQPPET